MGGVFRVFPSGLQNATVPTVVWVICVNNISASLQYWALDYIVQGCVERFYLHYSGHLHYSEKCLNSAGPALSRHSLGSRCGVHVLRGQQSSKWVEDYVLIVDEAISQSSLPSFDVAR